MKLPVFYRQEQATPNAASFSPSAIKPALVVHDWLQHANLKDRIEVFDFEPVSREDFYLAHDKDMVDGILDGTLANGFNNNDRDVARSLPYTTGSMLAAAEHAVIHRTHTCSPTSGFHHAGYAFNGGYCTFNGLMVTALALKKAGLIRNVAIIDCDVHYGNGTQDIIDHLELGWVKHYTMGRHFHSIEDVGKGGKRFLAWLYKSLEDCQGTDLVLYQAGADPHIQDPLGRLLSEEVMIERDCAVRSVRSPLAWNLAGGYQRDSNNTISPVIRLHRNTALMWVGAA